MHGQPGQQEMPKKLHEPEPAKTVQLPDSLKNIVISLKYESSADYPTLESIGLPQNLSDKIKIRVGGKYIYISRKDVQDPGHVRDYTIDLQVARLEINNKQQVVNFIPDDEKLAKSTLALLTSNPFFSKIVSTFNIETTSDDAEYISRLNTDADNLLSETQEIFDLKPTNPVSRKMIDIPNSEKSIEVHQGSVLLLDQKSSQEYLHTVGAGPCIIVVGYNKDTKKVGMVHADPFTNLIDATRRIIGFTGTQVTVLGGDSSSIKYMLSLKRYLDRQNISATWDILNEVKSIAVSKTTGEIFDLKTARHV